MNKLQLITKIKSHKAFVPMGYPDNYNHNSEWRTAYDDCAMYGKYNKYVNTTILDEWSTGGPSEAIVKETKSRWNNKELLKASVEELQSLLDAIDNQNRLADKYGNMSLLEFLTFIDLDSSRRNQS